MNRDKNILLTAGILLLLAVILTGVILTTRQPALPEGGTDTAATETDDEEWAGTIQYNGRTYVKNRDIKTVLFLGIDDKDSGQDLIGKGGRSDVIILLLVNKAEKTARMLEISRDTMMDVDVYDNDGKKIFTSNMQLCMQYSYGDSPSRSCRLTKNKVSQLLYGINIDSTCSLAVEGISVIVDGIGGVDITMPQDYTDIDPSYVSGAVVHMDGAQAERFVRSRDTEHSGGNDERMQRQNWFLLELVRQIKNNQQYLTSELMELADPYLETDLDMDMADLLRSCSLNSDSLKVPGETRMGELHDEFHVDDDALRELLIREFYLPA